MLTAINTQEATQRVMAAKLIRLTHKIAIQLHLVAESRAICSSHSRRPVQKLLVTPSIQLLFPTTYSPQHSLSQQLIITITKNSLRLYAFSAQNA